MTNTTRARLRLRRLDLARATDDPEVASLRARLVRRSAVPDARVRAAVREILAGLRADPDRGVREANERFGGGLPDGRLVLDRATLTQARDALPRELRAALEAAAANVRRFAETQRPSSSTIEIQPGVSIERRWQPLERVGCYVPGGGAAYPSTLVMTVVPAHVAGVDVVLVASPAGADGRLDPVVLGAAGLLEVDAFIVAGGAQAIGAFAFGLPGAGVAPVDRIVGPGNPWVTAAKLELVGEVGIDLPAGASEGLVLVDRSADPDRAAADLLTQAEHGPDSPAILVTAEPDLVGPIESAIQARLERAARHDVLERALADHGWIVVAPDLDAAIAFINDYAPEHLSVDVEDPEPTVARIRNAGSVFVGPWAPESAGDYATGANHVLPTGGLARSSGALSVEAYGKYLQVQRLSREGLDGLRPTIRALAEAEGLLAHRDAAEVRFERSTDEAGR